MSAPAREPEVVVLTDRDEAQVADKLRGALDMLRKGAYYGALLAINEAGSILERAVVVTGDGGEQHGDNGK